MRKKIKPLLLLLMAAGILALTGCGLFPKEEGKLTPPLVEPSEVTYRTKEAIVGDIEDSITVTGRLVPVHSENCFFKNVSGRLGKIYVIYGNRVKAGDLLAELIMDSLDKDIQIQKILVESKKNNIQSTEKLNALDARLAKDTLKRLEEKLAILLADEGSTSPEAVSAARLDVELQEISNERLTLSNANQLKMLRSDLETAQVQLDYLLRQQADAKLVASIDGVVTFVAALEEGDFVNAFDPVVRIADPTELLLEYIGGFADEFALGMRVDIETDVGDTAAEVVMTADSVPESERERYKETVRFRLDQTFEGLQMGSRATIKLVKAVSKDAVLIPRQALRTYNGSTIIYCLEDGLRSERSVKTGIETDRFVEILDGVEPGELVIVE